ncbi:MAG: ornithine--oxo-acid transaminase [Promethearchaeota archaeon]
MVNQKSKEYMELERKYGAHNYEPIPVVLEKANDIWVYDVEGKKYLDCLSSYSAINHGHLHPRIIRALEEQTKKLTLTSRAFYNNRLGEFLKRLCEFTGMEMALPMNTGAEAVETAIKIARRWGYRKKKVESNKAEIIVCENNFHGRTTTIVGFSSDPETYGDFGPPTPGFKKIEFNNLKALEDAITKNTVAFLVEPIQGEAGVLIPDEGYLKGVREICTQHNVLLILDEIQTGFGRTGKKFAFEHENIKPDILTVGKALGGGVYPVSAALTSREIMEVITPGSHGSTFGGNPLACAVGIESINILEEEGIIENAERMGKRFLEGLRKLIDKDNIKEIKDIRGKGLLIAVEFKKEYGKIRKLVEKLMENGILAKDTHGYTIRFAPPLTIKEADVDWAVNVISHTIKEYFN